MAKKASALSKDYNPIGSRLKQFNNDTASPPEKPTSSKEQSKTSEPKTSPSIIKPEEERLLEVKEEVFIDEHFPLEEGGKRTELKFRCSDSERERWHEFSQKVTGKRNRLSNVMRSLLLLLEHSEEQLEKLNHHLKNVKSPPKGDRMKTLLYEKKIASVLWEAIRRSSRP